MASTHFTYKNTAPAPSETHDLRKDPADTIIVPAKEDSFYTVFLGEWCWYPIRLGHEKLRTIKWIAVYQTSPVSAITHFAKIERIVDYLDTGRYKIVFEEPAELAYSVTIGDTSKQSFQGQRYTTIEKLKMARKISDLKPWN